MFLNNIAVKGPQTDYNSEGSDESSLIYLKDNTEFRQDLDQY
jgi:hypothetical protein